jgi:endoglucanase
MQIRRCGGSRRSTSVPARGALSLGAVLWSSVALGLGLACGKSGLDAARVTEGAKPAAPASGPAANVAYPATPKRAPPVPPPDGQGLSVELQRYIVVDQFGYLPDMTKIAVLVDPEQGWNAADSYTPKGEFEVRRWADGSVAFKSRVTAWNEGKLDANSGDRGAWFNFTPLREPGLYFVYDPEHRQRSHPFEIAAEVYDKVLKTAQRMFYFNRANFEKKKPFACQGQRCWLQGADYLGEHQDKAARSVTDPDNPKTARDLSGGWWDAGDTNKYVTFSAEPVHQLLTAYEERPEAFGDDLGIPESGNGIPDLIDELLVELSWLEKMQPDDLGGGVLLKMGNIEHGDPLPEASKFPRYYYPEPCSSAAIVAAGEFAHAALVLRDFVQLRERSAALIERAERAFAFYGAHPKSEACDDGKIKAGDADKPLAEQDQNAVVAAVYLYAATGKSEYDDYVFEHYASTEPFISDQWSLYRQHQGDALLYYTHLDKANGATQSAIRARKLDLSQGIDIYRMRPQFDLYRAFLRPVTFHWGSNNQRAAMGNTNYDLVQHALVKSPEDRANFTERAAGMLHSFHGVNPMQLTYLTNMYGVGGDACADEAFHVWFRDKDPQWDNARESEFGPAPGFVTGGPNKEFCKGQPADHACTKSPVRDQPPGKAYLDTNTGWEPGNPYDKSWELTEPAIYYQASYLRLLSKFVKPRAAEATPTK